MMQTGGHVCSLVLVSVNVGPWFPFQTVFVPQNFLPCWFSCEQNVYMKSGWTWSTYPNADMAHCLTSVGHCGYFCRASMIWLWSSISLISWYSLWVLAAVLSTGRISSSCCRCSKAWGRERSRNWLFIQKDKEFCLKCIFLSRLEALKVSQGSF